MGCALAVAILISTYNGSAYLAELLESVFNQSYSDIMVFARDDGSTDETKEILSRFNVSVLPSTERLGVKSSFSELLKYAVCNSSADFFMFCDQDDFWLPNKVEVTLSKMLFIENQYGDIPLLVHTDLQVVDYELKKIAASMWEYQCIDPSKNSVNRLFLQNTVTGCTAMINRRLAEFVLPLNNKAIMHDWWMALVASCFGKIAFLENQTVLYRQHADNVIGARGFFVTALNSALNLLFMKGAPDDSPYLEDNLRQAEAFLEEYKGCLNDVQLSEIYGFLNIRRYRFLERRFFLLRSGFIKQGFLRNLSLFIRI